MNAILADRPRRRATASARRVMRLLAGFLLLGLIGVGGWLVRAHFLAERCLRRVEEALQRQRYPEALRQLEQALRYRPRSAHLHLLAARTARQAGHVEQAWEHLAHCRRLYRGETAAEQLEHLLIRVQLGELEKVPRLWMYVTDKRPEAGLVLEAFARGYLVRRLFGPLGGCLARWLEIDPDNIQALIYQGTWYGQQGNTIGAMDSFAQALELDPEREDVRLELARVLLERTQFREALAHFRHVHRQTGRPEALLGMARAFKGLGDSAQARACLDQLLGERPDSAEALHERGRLALEQSRDDDAERDLRRAVHLDPSNPQARYNLAQCLRRQGLVAEALVQEHQEKEIANALDRIDQITRHELPARPASADLYFELGALCLKSGRVEQGLSWLWTALEHNPGHVPTRKLLAEHDKRQDELASPSSPRRQPRTEQ